MADGEALHELVGPMSQLEKDRRQGAVEQDWPREESRRASALRLAAWSRGCSHSYLCAYLRRQLARPGAPKAITATAHKLARSSTTSCRHGIAYMKKEEAAYAEQVRERLERQLHRLAQELGYELKKIEPAETATAAQ